jgi:transposase
VRVVSEFLKLYPDVKVDLTIGERTVDMIDEDFELAIRLTPPPDSSLIVRSLEHFPFSVNRRDSQRAPNKILWPSRAEEAAMGYSNDLRVRVIQVVEGGAAARAAARQFVIGDSTAIRWAKRWRETGSFEAKSNKGQSRSPLKKHEEWLLALVRLEPDLTLEEIQRRLLDERQQKAGLGSVWRFFDRHGISFKKKRSGGRAGSA